MYVTESLFAAVVPMLVYLFVIWKMDKFDPEPLGLILKSFLYGAFGAVIITLTASSLLYEIIDFITPVNYSSELIKTTLAAPFVEELAKGLYLFVLVNNRKFDNLTDGLVYGGAIGLGFGMTENFMYFLGDTNGLQGWIALVIIRTLFSAVMHCISTATLGGFIAIAKFSATNRKNTIRITGLATAMLLHFVWNFGVSFNTTALYAFILMLIIIIVFIVVFKISVSQEQKMILFELTDESNNGFIPASHPAVISSSKRKKTGWIYEPIRKLYTKHCIQLAFRKVQARLSQGELKLFYENEIDLQRNRINQLLEKAID